MYLARRKLPLNALRAFETAAKHCHLRKAAEELGVTHGAISRHISHLEDQFDTLLFTRSHNRLSLTPAGYKLFQGLKQGFDIITESTVMLENPVLEGQLVIASTTSISSSWLVKCIGEFHRRYPDIELRLKTISPFQTELASDIDVAICYGLPEAPDRSSEKLYREQYFPVASERRFAHLVDDLPALLGAPLLVDRHHHWSRWLDKFAPEHQSVRKLFFEDNANMVVAAKEGLGVALCDPLEVQDELQSRELMVLADRAVDSEQDFYLVCRYSQYASLAAQLFADYIRRFFHHKPFLSGASGDSMGVDKVTVASS